MFQTYPSAAFPSQSHQGLWKWIDLAVNAPIFMLEISNAIEDGALLTHRLTTSITTLREHSQPTNAGVLQRVFLLSPGYVNGTDGYQLDVLDSVYLSPASPMNVLFKLSNGRALYFSLGEDRLELSCYTDLVFKQASS